ncbi:MAG: hypothetical protein ACTHJM_15930 [Marmoricola sp.]
MSAHRDEHLYKILMDDVTGCGCGYSEEAGALVHAIVAHFAKDWQERPRAGLEDLFGGNLGAMQIVVNAIQDADLIDHGTSLYSSWVTEKGKWFLRAVEDAGGIDGLFDKLEYVGLPQHDGDWKRECTDECWKVA